jgi:colanic acid/amylovoran biosynthesis glycosyltransferase
MSIRNPVGYIVSQYPAVNHTFILREIRTLRSEGFDIRVVSIRCPDRPAESSSADESDEHRRTFSVFGAGVQHCIEAQVRTLASRPIPYLCTLWQAWKLAPRVSALFAYTAYFFEAVVAGDYLDRAGIRHAHTHFASTVVLLMAKLFPIRYSLTIHGPDEFNNVIGFHLAEKVEGAVFVSTISNYAASQVMRASDPKYWDKVHVARLGIDPAEFAPRRAPNRTDEGPWKLLFVGRLAPAKAQHLLLSAVAQLAMEGRRVHLTLVGSGPSQQSLVTWIDRLKLNSLVTLAGPCNHDRVIDYYRRTDIFTLASFAEGIPVVLMEAMAMEIPCVATWIMGIPELIDSGQNGLLVAPADVSSLARAITSLMDDPEQAARIGRAGREKIRTHFDLSTNTAQLGQLLERATSA